VDEEALGSRDVARGHSQFTYTTATTTGKPYHRSRSRRLHSDHQQPRQPPHDCRLHRHYPQRSNIQQQQPQQHLQQHHHRHQQQPSPLAPPTQYQTLPSNHRHKHHPRYYLYQSHQPRSASFSSLHNVVEGSSRCSSLPRGSRYSLKSPARSSPSPSPSPSPTPTPSPSPTTSRRVTPSPPAATVRTIPPQDIRRFQRHPLPRTERCCWGLLPRRWFTCRAKGTAGIDFVSRIAFPLMFILFNLGYWSTYLFQGDEGDYMHK
ncbi:G-box-binding factor-like, partial [Bombus affinis]|uniref:G-box-binding factor-like n=1 Tax=Bombus affinis TaxID=309941 RepID=UPI0021B7C838